MKKKYKFNVVDIIVILLILVVGVFIWHKFSVGVLADTKVLNEYEFKFYSYELPNFVIDYVEEGSQVYDAELGDVFGKVIEFSVGDSEVYNVNSDGKVVKSSKPDHSSMELVVKGVGEQTEYGVKISKGVYGVGHSLDLKVGNTKIYCKISGIERLD